MGAPNLECARVKEGMKSAEYGILMPMDDAQAAVCMPCAAAAVVLQAAGDAVSRWAMAAGHSSLDSRGLVPKGSSIRNG